MLPLWSWVVVLMIVIVSILFCWVQTFPPMPATFNCPGHVDGDRLTPLPEKPCPPWTPAMEGELIRDLCPSVYLTPAGSQLQRYCHIHCLPGVPHMPNLEAAAEARDRDLHSLSLWQVTYLPLCGIFYFPWRRHQIDRTNAFSVSSERHKIKWVSKQQRSSQLTIGCSNH